MKTILILSNLEEDTIAAVRTAIRCVPDANTEIVLLLPGEADTAFSAAAFLRTSARHISARQLDFLEDCRDICQDSGVAIKVHHQAVMSAMIMKNLLLQYEPGLVMLPESLSSCSRSIHRNCIAWIASSRLPMLQLSQAREGQFKNALFVNTGDAPAIHAVQERLSGNLPVRIVSQAKLDESQSLETVLEDKTNLREIDLVVSTRRSGKSFLKNFPVPDFGLPLLTLHEETV